MEKKWIIQRCINAFQNQYQDWPGFFEHPMSREEMLVALEHCNNHWPDYEFRGHIIEARNMDDAYTASALTENELAAYQAAALIEAAFIKCRDSNIGNQEKLNECRSLIKRLGAIFYGRAYGYGLTGANHLKVHDRIQWLISDYICTICDDEGEPI